MNSGGVGNGTLSNGTGWNSTTGTFTFDGSDDLISIGDSNNFNNITWSNGITLAVWYNIRQFIIDFNSQFRCMIGVATGGRSFTGQRITQPNFTITTVQIIVHF
jgi:hypothetical protein